MIIECCKKCPFFHNTMLAMLATKGVGGVCAYDAENDRNVVIDADLKHGTAEHEQNRRESWARMKVPNPEIVPDQCPLRKRDVIITLGLS